jgi:hypothetical protein
LNATPTIAGVALPGDGRTVNASSQIESWVKQKVAINIIDDHIEKDISFYVAKMEHKSVHDEERNTSKINVTH